MQHSRPNEFVALVAMLTAMVAMSIDSMLPALGLIANELGATAANDRQLIILGFFGGMMLGTLIFGPISDSVGRKPAIFAGLALYCVGSAICIASQDFTTLVLGRVLQGFGAASPRVVSMAMVRDGASGAAMARVMSFVMSVFMLVPILAPSIGQLVLYVASWRWIFVGLMAAAVIAGTWLAFRQEETLALDRRLAFSPAALWNGAREVVRHPVSLGYTVAVGFLFGAFVAFLGTSQQIFAEQYAQGDLFAVWFAFFASGIAAAMITNGRTVMKLGMRLITKWALRGFLLAGTVMLLLCLATAGHPPLWTVALCYFALFFFSGLMFGNYNALAMEPMGHIAGMAAAITGSFSSLIAVVAGGVAGRLYDNTMLPLTIAFVAFGLCSLAFSTWAERWRARVNKTVT
jgi:MFS transporter, DHA1 family, multidrug resistance protein